MSGRDRGRVCRALVGAAVVSLVAAGCSGANAGPTPTPKIDAPLGSAGRWEPEFREALSLGVSDYEAGVLSDGRVTAAELEETHRRVDRCLADSGYSISYATDGGFEIGSLKGPPPSNDMSKTNRVLEACEKQYDESITFLYESTRRNPQKQDEAAITVRCLQKAGLVGKDYSERKWRAEYDAGVFSFPEYDTAAKQCTLDPLGLWRTP